jgi:subtilisin family serine protease/subtilisin-like proprotein convertase family protein
MESLEQRVLLTGLVNGNWPTEIIQWYGGPMEVVKDSWLITFDRAYGSAEAVARTNQIIAALGVVPDAGSVQPLAQGRWARFSTPADLTMPQAMALKHLFPFVQGFEPEGVARPSLVPNDAEFGQIYAHLNTGQTIQGVPGLPGADMSTTLAWDLQTGSRSVIIAVLDTGIDLLHPDLQANLWTNPGEIPNNGVDDDGNGLVDDVYGYDFSGNNDNNVQVAAGASDHGVAVAGCIGAVGNNGIGVVGVAWQVSILTVKIFPDAANPLAAFGDIVEGIDYVTRLRRDFNFNIVAINGSYGSVNAENPSDTFDNAQAIAIQEFTDAGGLFVASAGNDSNNNDGPNFAYPASFPNEFIISVAATDNQDQLAGFSNYGATSVDLGAPGVSIRTCAVGGGYQYIDGTSFSAPYTAGVIALMASASSFATQAQLKNALLNGVDPIPALAGITLTGGRVNANNSLRLIGFPGPIVTDISPGTLSGPVDEVIVGFSKAIDPAFFAVAGVELRGTNGDDDFNANDVFYTFASSDVSFIGDGSVVRFRLPGGNLPLDTYRLTLFNQYFRDFEGNYLNGTTAGGNDHEYAFRIIAGAGPLEPNDQILQATPVIFGAGGTVSFSTINIGDGPNPSMDVDLYRLTLAGPGLITVQVDARNLPSPSDLDSYLRLFDASGRELARNDNFYGLDSRIQYFVGAGGRYYVGVSGFGNSTYLPGSQASGTPGGSTGVYNIRFTVSQTQSTPASFTNPAPTAIPTQGTINSTIFVPDIREVRDVNVRINIAHTYVGDLEVRLIGPDGTVVPLVLGRGGSSNLGFINTVFDDEAATPITAGTPPFTGSFVPEGSLADLDGISASGFWTLRITDTRALNGGTLQNWRLDLLLENSISGPFEYNDTLLTATDTGLSGAASRTFDAAIGDGAYGLLDVDLYRFIAPAGTTVTATTVLPALNANGAPNLLHSVLRLFDQQGNPLVTDSRIDGNTASITFPVTFAGTFYIGVSGGLNLAYNPDEGGSGISAGTAGLYSLTISIVGGITTGAAVLQGTSLTVGLAADGAIGPAGNQAVGIALAGGDEPTEFVVPAGSPASIESFYGASFGGFLFRNAGVETGLPVRLTNESDFANRRVEVTGLFRANIPQDDQGGGLLVRRSISFGVADSFLAIDVVLTNTTFDPLPTVRWVEGLRPRHAGNLGSAFTRTVNDIDNATGRLATATYTNADFPGGATIGLGAAAPAAGQSVFLSVEPVNTVRDATQVIDTPVDPNGAEADGTLAIAFILGDLDPGRSARFRYFVFVGPSLASVQQRFQSLEGGTGTGHLVEDPADPSLPAASLPYALYYPEGYANSRASTFLPLVNPHDDAARVVVTARYEDPANALPPTVLFDGTLDPNSRGGITITTPALYAAGTLLVRKDTPYALEIKSSLPIGATLSHYDFGIATGQAFTSRPSTVWTFSEGFKSPGVNDFLVLYNTEARTVKVDLTVFRENSSQRSLYTMEVGAQRRSGLNLALMPGIADGPFAMRLDAEGAIVAALTHFDGNLGGGFSILGVPGLGATSGVSPEGQFGLNAAAEFVTILNTGSTPAQMEFTFYFQNQSAYRRQIFVPAGQRSGFNVALLPGFPRTSQPYSVGYTSNVPVSVSLSSFAFGSGTGTRFTNDARTVWLFSEGFRPGAGSAVTEYLRLFNPTVQNVTVEITLDFAEVPAQGSLPAIPAGSVVFRRTLTGRAANDFDIHEFITGDRASRDVFYSVSVRAPVPVVAYSAHFDATFGSGFGTLGTDLGAIAAAIV